MSRSRGRDEIQAAYFALLRAREELDALRRYGEFLANETRRIRRFRSEGEALDTTVDARLRRALRHTDGPLAEALKDRLAVIDDELQRLTERIEAAEAFVSDCEREHQELRDAV